MMRKILIGLFCFIPLLLGTGQSTSFAQDKKLPPIESYFPDSAFLAFHSSTKEIWDSLDKEGKMNIDDASEQLEKNLGFTALDIEQVATCVITSEVESIRENGVPIVFIFRFKKSFGGNLEEIYETNKENDLIPGVPTALGRSFERAAGPVFCVPDSRTVLIGGKDAVIAACKKKEKPTLANLMKKRKKADLATMICQINNNSDNMETLKLFCRGFIRLGGEDELHEIIENLDSFELTMSKEGETIGKGKFRLKKGSKPEDQIEMAEEIRDIITGKFSQRVEVLKRRDNRFSEGGVKMLSMIIQLIDSTKLEKTEDGANLTVKYKKGFKSLTKLSAEIAKAAFYWESRR